MIVAKEFEYCDSDEYEGSIKSSTIGRKGLDKEMVAFPEWIVPINNGESAEYNNIRQELYNSELAYVKYLLAVQKLFVNPIASMNHLVKRTDVRALFGEITSIFNFNKELLSEMRKSTSVSDVFVQLSPFLKIYAAYARNYSNSQKVFNKLMLKSEFRDFIEDQEKDTSCRGIKFSALMIMPVQRIPRYVLMLKRLISETSSEDEKTNLEEVLSQMNEITDLIECCIADYENGERLWNIQESLGLKEDIVGPGRRVIKEGSLYKRSHCGEAIYNERIFWLFNDILVYGKRRMTMGPKYECSCIYPVRHCTVEHNEIDGSLLIKCKSHSILVTSESYDVLKSWYDEINKAVERTKILRSTLRKESSRQQVKEFRSQIKKQLTKKFVNKTYLYELGSTRKDKKLAAHRKRWEQSVSEVDEDINVMNSPFERPVGQRKRKSTTAFDRELKLAVDKRRMLSASSSSSADESCSPRKAFTSIQNTRRDEKEEEEGVDEPDRVPRMRSRIREEVKNRASLGTLTHPEIRKYSYQETSAVSTSDSQSSRDVSPLRSPRYRDVPWWVVEATPAQYLRRQERRGIIDTVRSSCSLM